MKMKVPFIKLHPNAVMPTYGSASAAGADLYALAEKEILIPAGKTVFVKGVAKGLGIEEEVTSPTYAYMNDYDGRLFHYDCYRIESIEQAEQLGLADYFDMGGICLIEWSQNIAALLPKNVKRVTIRKIDEEKREIEY